MNCPSRNDDTLEHPEWNQNPPPFSPDITTRNDFNGLANSRVHRKHADNTGSAIGEDTMSIVDSRPQNLQNRDPANEKVPDGEVFQAVSRGKPSGTGGSPRRPFKSFFVSPTLYCAGRLAKFARFVGPGFLIAVAYIDPGNYATGIQGGSQFKYALLFIILLSNIFAILLQSLCVKLGSVTGLNLAENCREHLPRWLVYILYVFAEAAIIATDIAEVSVARATCILDYTNSQIGGWLGDRAELAFPRSHSPGSRMCYHTGGCLLSSPLLAS